MRRLPFIIQIILLSLSLSAHADRVYYQIKMSGNPVGYITYEVKPDDDDLTMQTTVLFNIGQSELNQKIKLTSDTRLNAQTQLPIEYELSTFINGFTQSTVETTFEGDTATQRIVAGGQNFDNEISLPEPTYLVDDNFRIDHYNVLLRQFDFRKRGTQSFYILTPLAVPRQPKAVELHLTWAGGEKLTVREDTYQTEWLQSHYGGMEMDFWFDKQSRQIVKWDIPSQKTEIILADESVLPTKDAIENRLAALRQDSDLPRLKVNRELGAAADLIALQMRLDLQVSVSGELGLDVSNQWFEGKVHPSTGTANIVGVLNVKSYELPERAPKRRPIQDSRADELPGEIEVKAREIAAGADTSYDAVKAVVHWVTQEISHIPKMVSVDECLSNKSGNALARSRLAVELIRSLGVPANVLGGLLYTNNGVFVQHHWIEVNLGGNDDWMAMDALTGETEGVGAAHVALWRGNGRLAAKPGKMEVLDFQSAMITWQDLIPLQVGERNQYTIERDGGPIGVSANRVERIITHDGVQCYQIEGALSLDDEVRGQITAHSRLYLTLNGKALYYQSEMDVNGEVKSYEYTREGTRFRFARDGERFKMWVEKVPHFIGDFSFWGWDLIFRQQELSTELQWEVDLIDPRVAALRSFQVVVEDAEEIVVNDKRLSCFRINVDGQLFWVSSVGRLIRYHDPERNLTVELVLE